MVRDWSISENKITILTTKFFNHKIYAPQELAPIQYGSCTVYMHLYAVELVTAGCMRESRGMHLGESDVIPLSSWAVLERTSSV